jgi:hypothetical protein
MKANVTGEERAIRVNQGSGKSGRDAAGGALFNAD